MLPDRPAAVDAPNAPAPGDDDAPADSLPLEVIPLTEPADGIPPIVDTSEALARVVADFGAGTGPVAVDAERASGYRYGQHTFLVQLRREGAGTALIDPIALPDLSSLSDALVGVEWVLHAASQDLPGLSEQNLRPSRVFDTELGARLLGLERVGLAAVVAELLGLGLAKEHSAVDWSTRPLPEQWLRYAALDVEVLVELRTILAERLALAGKAEWAAQEFEAVRLMPPPAPRVDPWRRVSGLHSRRQRPAARHRTRPRPAGCGDRRGRTGTPPRGAPARRAPVVLRKGHPATCGAVAARDRRRDGAARVRAPVGARTEVRRTATAPRMGRPRPDRGGPADRRT